MSSQILPFRGADSGYAVRKREELTFTIRPSFPLSSFEANGKRVYLDWGAGQERGKRNRASRHTKV